MKTLYYPINWFIERPYLAILSRAHLRVLLFRPSLGVCDGCSPNRTHSRDSLAALRYLRMADASLVPDRLRPNPSRFTPDRARALPYHGRGPCCFYRWLLSHILNAQCVTPKRPQRLTIRCRPTAGRSDA